MWCDILMASKKSLALMRKTQRTMAIRVIRGYRTIVFKSVDKCIAVEDGRGVCRRISLANKPSFPRHPSYIGTGDQMKVLSPATYFINRGRGWPMPWPASESPALFCPY